jgi:hypothetical protein
LFLKKQKDKLWVVVHASNPSTWGRSRRTGSLRLGLCSETISKNKTNQQTSKKRLYLTDTRTWSMFFVLNPLVILNTCVTWQEITLSKELLFSLFLSGRLLPESVLMRDPLESAFLTLLMFGVEVVYGEAKWK